MPASILGITLLALWLAASVHASIYPTHTYTLASTAVQSAASSMQTNSGQGPFDGPKLDFVDTISFDWWYFEVASYDTQATLVVTFFSASAFAISPPGPAQKINTVQIYGSFPNGTLFSNQVEGGEAVVVTVGDGSSGTWTGTGAGWAGTPDLSLWNVTFNVPQIGFKGKIVMESKSPAHYFSAPASVPNVSEEALPSLGWANAVPDAFGSVNADILGTPLIFAGSGYHDQNWSNRFISTLATSWVWGHASVGSFSLVFWQFITNAGVPVNNLYVTRGQEILALGAQSLTLSSDNSITISLDTGSSGRFSFTGVPTLTTINTTGYHRWFGKMSGGLVGVDMEGPGPAMWEYLILH